MHFAPIDLGGPEAQAAAASVQILETKDQDGRPPGWTPLFKHECGFDAAAFDKVMLNTIRNPNLNSSWLFRADILLDQHGPEVSGPPVSPFDQQPPLPVFQGLDAGRLLVRRMIPRNEQRDRPLEQTCAFYAGSAPDGLQRSMVIYLPHVKSESDMPFYHPAVKGIAFLHDWNSTESKGTVSIHYCFFGDGDRPEKLTRTALNLLRVLYKHGEGQVAGYKKRVKHDVVVPQVALQNRYATLKQKYARSLVVDWEKRKETTDAMKHVFEDLCIAAFLIELWEQMYTDVEFPGFVDIGCGNGLLVHILNRENYSGWGFDARARKSWAEYSTQVQVRTWSGSLEERQSLETRVLLPAVIRDTSADKISDGQIHDGLFPRDTFIISNHADELTPWTPILARVSDCPFIMIPCCSHDLTGARFRAPPPKDKTASSSAYKSLCEWVAQIASDCGWMVEREMLRIPSTRNTAFVGRRSTDDSQPDIHAILQKYGGTQGYYDNVVKLLKANTRGH